MPLSIAPGSPHIPVMQPSFPAKTKQAASMINGILTDVTSTTFSDKIMITITQDGRLAHWIHVPLDSPTPRFADQYLPSGGNEDALLPIAHLTPKTLLGGSTSERETVGQLYATQIASVIVTRNPEEKRTVIIGFGLKQYESNREVFYDTVELVEQCL
ncbi:hypothetical protein N7G274_008171 [Stereocaulon virgatum]|uniref:Proteasome assembly chaperone 3 n=1 Tax=Stereocaulon virgatum TaxID=373712 RepID=A0ABR4A424_9LECA